MLLEISPEREAEGALVPLDASLPFLFTMNRVSELSDKKILS